MYIINILTLKSVSIIFSRNRCCNTNYKEKYVNLLYCMNFSEFTRNRTKYVNGCLNFYTLSNRCLQQHNFHCHYSKLRYEKLSETDRLVVSEEN